MIKKLLAVLLAATLFFTLTACGSDKDTASSEPVDSPSSEDISSEESSSASGGIVTEDYIGDGGFGGKGDGTAPDSQGNQTADTSTGDNRYDDSIGYESATHDNEYHTYGYEWTPSEMIMYVDGNKVMTYDIVTNFGKFDMKGFHDPQFLMFNNHLFNKDSNWKPANNLIENNEQMLPAVYEIEYFRLYQKNDGKSKIYLDKTINPYNR